MQNCFRHQSFASSIFFKGFFSFLSSLSKPSNHHHHHKIRLNENETENDATDDPESACYRTRTTELTSSSVKCVDVCVEFENDDTKTSNRVCRSSPILESNASENACERACADAYYHSTSLKFHANEQKMKDYERLRDETCKKECSRAFFSEQQQRSGHEATED